MNKTKVLLLGTHDSKLTGHIQYVYNQIKDYSDAVMVTRFGFYGNATHCYWPLNGRGLSFVNKIRYFRFSRLFFFFWRYIYSFVRFGCLPIVDKKHPEYSFGDFEFLPYTAKDIIKKCPKGFIPDIIVICWSSRFVSSKIIQDLYQFSKAKIIYCFMDEAPMTGGCHYPNQCKEYLSGCNNCPALAFGKKMASIQMREKLKNLKNIPLYFQGAPYDIRLAKETGLFKNSIPITVIDYPKVNITPQKESRLVLGVPENKFVVLIGASSVESVRKGFIYSINSINIANKRIKELFVLVIGNTNKSFKDYFPDVDMLELGFVNTDKMVMAYCASDCFLSTTIADSGPQMVNFSIATGTPVVSFSMGIAQDLVIHKKTGYIAEFKNADDLATGMEYLYGLSTDQKKMMGKECMELIKEKSSIGGWEQKFLGM